MRIKTIRLKKFKRFDDLTIELGEHPKKIVALVGPNGCGKSSVFDAFEQKLQDHVGVNNGVGSWFFSKELYESNPVDSYQKHNAIQIINADNNSNFSAKSFYVRTAYRYTPQLRINSIQQSVDPINTPNRPGHSANIDQRLQDNYTRLHGLLLEDFYKGSKTGDQVREELVGNINSRLKNILDVRVSNLGNVVEGKGQLFFEKDGSTDFPFENLSSGEKEVVDLIIDLELKRKYFDDTVFCIDEPELHLNTSIQRKLLKELADLIPSNCQLWVATHSIGFLRALQDELAADSQILDFSEKNYFSGTALMYPMFQNRAAWSRIFETALEDLSGLVSPKTIIYCEGRAEPSEENEEQGFDALIYNSIFNREFIDTLFISSGGGEVAKNSALALKVLGKALRDVNFLILKDRDDSTEEQRIYHLSASTLNRVLQRRELENYLFDKEIMKLYFSEIDEQAYDGLVQDIYTQDLKVGQLRQKLMHLTNFRGTLERFMRELAECISKDTQVYKELKGCIFV